MALHPNFDTRDDCSKRVQLGGANRVRRMPLLPIGFPGKNRGMHPHRVQLLQAEVSVHPHRVQMHPVLVHFGLTHSLAKPINPRDVISNICVQLIYVDFNRRAINGL